MNVLSVCDQEVDNLMVKSIRCTDMPDPFIKNVTADIIMLGLGKKKYEADRKTRWFTVTVIACLKDGTMTLNENETRIKEYASGTWDKTTALDEFGVPYENIRCLSPAKNFSTRIKKKKKKRKNKQWIRFFLTDV